MDSARWERLDKDTHRMRVPGGWLVRASQYVRHSGNLVDTWVEGTQFALAFVPDPDHAWKVSDEQ